MFTTFDCGGSSNFLTSTSSIVISDVVLRHMGPGDCTTADDDYWQEVCAGIDVVWTSGVNTAMFQRLIVLYTVTTNTSWNNVGVYVVSQTNSSSIVFQECLFEGNTGGAL